MVRSHDTNTELFVKKFGTKMRERPFVTLVNEFITESNAIECEYSQAAFEDSVIAWMNIARVPYLTVPVILQAHNDIMKNLRPDIAGRLRGYNVHVGVDAPPGWQHVPRLVREWLDTFSEASEEAQIWHAHKRFEWIHPFVDGNGRTGRMIMNWQRMHAGLPILVINESEKEAYFSELRKP